MTIWEYKIETVVYSTHRLGDMQKLLNRYGKEGWQLVAIIKQNGIFKREKKE